MRSVFSFREKDPALYRTSLLLAATALVITGLALGRAWMPSRKSAAVTASAHVQSVSAPLCYAGLSGTRLAFFAQSTTETPLYVTDIDVRKLPAADRESLQKRVALYSREDIAQLVEDLDS